MSDRLWPRALPKGLKVNLQELLPALLLPGSLGRRLLIPFGHRELPGWATLIARLVGRYEKTGVILALVLAAAQEPNFERDVPRVADRIVSCWGA
jgi:hypothetical protein